MFRTSMTTINLIADCETLCGESPLWKSEEQALYWTDIAGCKLYRYQSPEQGSELVLAGLDGFEVSGLAHHESGSFIVVTLSVPGVGAPVPLPN